MRYFVAHLLDGKAKAFHERLTRELTARFHTEPLFNRIPPHITIKPPFEADEAGIQEVERILRAFASGERAAPFRVSGFGRFGFRTIYLNVAKSPEAVSLVRRAIQALNKNIPWMPEYPLEGNKLHASVARFLTRRKSRHVWRFLKPLAPDFSASFDSFAILKKEEGRWSVHAVIPLRREGDTGYSPIFEPASHADRVLVL